MLRCPWLSLPLHKFGAWIRAFAVATPCVASVSNSRHELLPSLRHLLQDCQRCVIILLGLIASQLAHRRQTPAQAVGPIVCARSRSKSELPDALFSYRLLGFLLPNQASQRPERPLEARIRSIDLQQLPRTMTSTW